MEKPTTSSHVVAIPYPGWGHVNPLLNFCKLLTLKKPSLHVTFIVTEEWLGLLGSFEPSTGITCATIPNVIPSEVNRGADLEGFMHAIMTKMTVPVAQVVDQLEPPVHLIIADTFLSWTVEIAIQRSIPVASFWTMSASMFSMFYHYDLIVDGLDSSADQAQVAGDEHRIDYIPGFSPIRLADLPDGFSPGHKSKMSVLLRSIYMVENVQYLVFKSIHELEQSVIHVLKPKLPIITYTVGPCLPRLNLENVGNQPGYLHWLNSLPQKSVLYVSLGSVIVVTSEQIDELAAGLYSSGVTYLWVVRGEVSRLKDTCGEKGMIVPWCDQLGVLSHSSVGGFLTHCGWNSVLEGAFVGVPMLTFPLFFDQKVNSKLVVEDWEIGWRLRTESTKSLVKREEIARIIKRFMDLESDERKDLRRDVERCRKYRNQQLQEDQLKQALMHF